MKEMTKVVFMIIAALIGAGFSSGQEIYTFFYVYGKKGILGLALCSGLLTCIIYSTFRIIQENKNNSYHDFIDEIIGKKHKSLKLIMNNVVNIFLMITFFIMIAGFGAFFYQELHVNSFIGSTILAIVCFITFITSVSGVVKINNIIVPGLIFFIVLISIRNIITIDIEPSLESIKSINDNNWLVSATLYCSYNSILLIPILVSLNKLVNRSSKMKIAIISVVSGVLIFFLAVSIFVILTRCRENLELIEMPALYVIGKYFAEFRIIYSCIILLSIYTTAISIGISFLENVSFNRKSYLYTALFICIAGVATSGIGFSRLVAVVYPVFGYLGLIQICQMGRIILADFLPFGTHL